MPIPAKPCPGLFSEETITALTGNIDRAQWLDHPCALCGQQVGARIEKGKWLPEPHWPSVRYKERTRSGKQSPQRSKPTVLTTT